MNTTEQAVQSLDEMELCIRNMKFIIPSTLSDKSQFLSIISSMEQQVSELEKICK